MVKALPKRLGVQDRTRLESTIRGGLRRVRKRSRPQVLAEKLSARLGREIGLEEVRRADSMRGKYAHGSAEAGVQPDPEVEQLLQQFVWEVLKENAGVNPAQGA
jgi:hypothetical protein